MHRAALIFLVTVSAISSAVLWVVSRDRSLERYRAAGVIRIGYAVEAPFAFSAAGGQVTGESPEMAKSVGRHLGIERIEWRQTEFNALISELENGFIDVIAAGMFITAQRAKRVSFSEPTFHVLQALLVSRGNPKKLHSYGQALGRKDIRIRRALRRRGRGLASGNGLFGHAVGFRPGCPDGAGRRGIRIGGRSGPFLPDDPLDGAAGPTGKDRNG